MKVVDAVLLQSRDENSVTRTHDANSFRTMTALLAPDCQIVRGA